jgi:hypothetical protein
MTVFSDRIQRLIRPTWYLLNITAGFEIWSGGRGLQVTNFWARG